MTQNGEMEGTMRKLTFITMALVMFLTVVAVSPSQAHAQFSDVTVEEVDRLVENDIVRGFPNNRFYPQQDVTRAEAAVMIGRSLGLSGGGTTSFSDVSGHWAEAEISAAVKKGILKGYPDGSFKPNQNLSRGEMAAVLTRSFSYEAERTVSFSDVRPGMNFNNEISILANSGISNGFPDGTFGPTQSIIRLDFSLMLARTLYPEYRPEIGSVDVGDVIGTGTVVRTPSLNVRPDNSTTYPPIGTLREGTTVNVHKEIGNWAHISSGSLTGYVSQSYLTLHDGNVSGKLRGKTVVVDAGHGGTDPGGSGNGLVEKGLALDVSLRLEAKLKEAGANVVMTRRSDWYPSLGDRVRQANNSGADIFISIHFNAAASTAARGTETFYNTTYSSANSKKLSDSLQKNMLEKLKTVDRGVKTQTFYVIRHTTMPSALVELGFMTNYAEAQRINTRQFREDGAQALYDGVVDYFN